MENAKSKRIQNQLLEKYKIKDKQVKKNLKEDKQKWLNDQMDDAQKAVDMDNMKTLYKITKSICNEKPCNSATINNKEGKTITEDSARLTRWKEYFEEILNRETPTNPSMIDTDIPEVEINTEPISKDEVRQLPKKGNLRDCINWRGITLLIIASKVLGKILMERMKQEIDAKLRQEQAGFRQGRSTTEQIFIIRNIIEQTHGWQASLILNFIDFEKAFDSLHTNSLWDIMKLDGIPSKLNKIIQLLYQDSKSAVLDGGQASEWFQVKTGVKQGCVMSGFLFLLAIDWIMQETTNLAKTGIRWKFPSQLEDLDYADDIALISTNHRQMQKTDKLTEAAQRVGLNISKSKTCILKINYKNNNSIKFQNGQDIQETNDFTYLGACVSADGGADNGIESRLCKAKTAFRKLRKVWSSKQYIPVPEENSRNILAVHHFKGGITKRNQICADEHRSQEKEVEVSWRCLEDATRPPLRNTPHMVTRQ
ncbi:Transposon TX1 uncharacterized 149 kDa protein [Stylophora pistillata]|uniref:Transposon TX1 uncharacterized 149 kDa protein n=1 Tax=Stylophora pistillata TaxID=50429 RepID=A0A2B4RE56_STYPI|nr:Transposon TX1 uncharacterized 149 kDa protein [Stylophora pistillata]